MAQSSIVNIGNAPQLPAYLAQPEGKWAPFDRSGWRSLVYPDPNR